MRRDQLEHLIRAAGQVLEVDEVIVIGSQAILASVSSGLPVEATRSIEADILPLDDPDEAKADLIDGLLGEASMFQQTHGIYAQGVGQHTARLPMGWQERLIPLSNENTAGITGWCLDPHDLCASKLLAGRPKDSEFCRAVLATGIVDPAMLTERLELTDASDRELERAASFITAASRDRVQPVEQPLIDEPDLGLDL